MLLVVLCWR